ncbi:AcrR family transcriptional regulator [Pullulanibacillus pueri]|uniref:TetR family transcriptional regulator n=1 Tax=Pullulanibacillus pueri TaxID=1437324 RepID=A0A8J3ER39_9BACL|nr:forespore capture DNA-binding protein RefZ [Pullulanibacillus pueri]MBM7683964.1 AcrR family transcriptional regulator [Pullulanibacillus pueri]GGH88099.1 TetR family transcriptional regulator [Pullulanibacillus pueri]
MIVKAKGKKKQTKQEIIKATITLFHMYGYNGTSVRDIATEANVNVALVSYYFGSKKALLEYLMEFFYTGYIDVIEQAMIEKMNVMSKPAFLYELAERLIRYQQSQFHLSLFVHREVTLDSTLVRELMTTYLMKEKYLMEGLFEEGMMNNEIRNIPLDLLVLQYRDMIVTPFLQPLYLRKVHVLEPSQTPFVERYSPMIKSWIEQISQPKMARNISI